MAVLAACGLAAAATAAVGWCADPTIAIVPDSMSTSTPEPHVLGVLPTRVGQTLDLAFALALQRLREEPACRDLFSSLGTDGIGRLSRTLYLPPRQGEERFCRSGVAAFTCVGMPHTRLCPAFGALRSDRAAIVLLHEALHFAGLGEKPPDRNAPTAIQINDLVEKACGL